MKVADVYVKALMTIIVLCLVLVTISYLTRERTIKVETSVRYLSPLPVISIPTAEAPIKRNVAGFTGPPLLAKA